MTDKTPAPMRIKEFRAENFKRLKVVDIRPDGALVQITGKNGQGKTSCLDGIWVALAGLGVAQSVPIRKGQERAVLKLDMGSLIVTRTFIAKEGGTFTHQVKVESDEGAKFSSPQAVLDALVGELSFDPLGFTRMGAKAQFEALKALVPGVDFAAIARTRQEAFDTRRAKKGRAEELRAQAGGIALPAGKIPAEVDVAALEAKLADAGNHNSLIERRKARRDETGRRLDDDWKEAADLEDKLEDLRARIDATVREIEAAEPLPDPIDTAQVQADLQAARANNAVAAQAARRREIEGLAATVEAEVVTLTETIKDADAERDNAVRAAKMPVEGLGFGDEAILLNGLPFDQASDAEQLRASIAIAGALNPRLRVIRVRDGSLLDEDAMKLLEQYAETHDLQVWIETVGTGPNGFIMENGVLKGEPDPDVQEDEEGF
jgi:hypothetical protein